MSSRHPTSWDQYERGNSPGRGSVSSTGQHSVSFAEGQSLLGDHEGHEDHDNSTEWMGRLRRRSSVTNRLAAITEIGGVNSIRSFTRSWQRAAVFPEVIPQRPSFVFAPDQEPADPIHYGRTDVETGPRTSLLRSHLEANTAPENAILDTEDDAGPAGTLPHRSGGAEGKLFDNDLPGVTSPSGSARTNSVFEVPPHLSGQVPFVGSYSSYVTYGTVDSEISRPSMAEAGELWRQQQEAGVEVPNGEHPRIMVKEVEQDGKFVLAVAGQSTLPQTVVNSTNVLIGVGLLSLPIGMRYAGWLVGMVALFCCAAVTSWTARLLSKCMDLDPTLITFSDVAYISFGKNARVITSIVFTLELIAACVALIVLFADSLSLLFPGMLSVNGWKVICAVVLIPFQFAPLRILSYTSFLGILSVLSIAIIVILDGLIKPHGPGSLIEPAATYLFPENWLTLPLSFGLLMSPWGGHGVFPNIYRDMRHPHRYKEAVTITFSFTYLLDVTMAVVGLIMFGDGVRDEITSNILRTTGYPEVLNVSLVIFIAIIPLTKIPLNAQPIVTTMEVLAGLRQHVMADNSALLGRSSAFRGVMKIVIRIMTLLILLIIAILFPDFDSIMAFMGSALCFTICVTLPLAFYLKLFGHEIMAKERILAWFVMTTSFVLSVIGTVWAFLPKSLIGITT
ncbi:transmembrane amino acid transporter protein-domain-containing protein [Pseudomassariella vexata]|uniref:Transmembrane amino acid transporter protein-domain-containing protein n=1 Tax=Pseudomassariella vexata TaxID=1141098 RepID=A0A1Y2DW73_9PEZI|nr:transmembrane amino acid transporter protein-domain-containing protein [Pseudomassariella vexata]ORY63513.1 transmembrane amino acid transporter protein-domain-containing protein [Pseudomassariella vexata]